MFTGQQKGTVTIPILVRPGPGDSWRAPHSAHGWWLRDGAWVFLGLGEEQVPSVAPSVAGAGRGGAGDNTSVRPRLQLGELSFLRREEQILQQETPQTTSQNSDLLNHTA